MSKKRDYAQQSLRIGTSFFKFLSLEPVRRTLRHRPLDTSPAFRFTHPPMSAPVEIRNSASSNTFQVIAPFIGAAVAGVLAFRGLSSDGARGPVFLLIAFAIGCLRWGLFKASSGFDSGVQVTLDSRGFATSAPAMCWCPGRR
ncbi:hypothetical protein [Mesorhizobium sp. NZP2298]|uniref:hypothetical protein n=1 Tax=Mesorhizobium sp. NZP2298 TaxID=2483403 RepID=UPI0015545261|nr:hypothetical protein [Mesorhizobium sp. NZP2298]QKC94042.1 hypothetical protein EB231_04430 [Mesorhizobium sp. NZP2298]